MAKRLNAFTLALVFIPVSLLGLTCPAVQAAPLQVSQIPENGSGFLFVDFESLRKNRIGEMFGESESFQREFANMPIGEHTAIRSMIATSHDAGSIAVMLTVVGSGQDWFDRLAGDAPRETTENGQLKFVDRNKFVERSMGQFGRTKANGSLFVATDEDRVFLAGNSQAITDWQKQLEDGRRAAWLEQTELTAAPVMCVRRLTEEPSGFRHVFIDTVDQEVRIRVVYHTKSAAKAALLAMLKPEVVTKMLTALQQQSESQQAQAKQQAAEIASQSAKNDAPANAESAAESAKANTMNIAIGFQGDQGFAECVRFLRRTFEVKSEGLKISVQWQGLLDLEYDHTIADAHLYSFQFLSSVEKQLEVAGGGRDVKLK